MQVSDLQLNEDEVTLKDAFDIAVPIIVKSTNVSDGATKKKTADDIKDILKKIVANSIEVDTSTDVTTFIVPEHTGIMKLKPAIGDNNVKEYINFYIVLNTNEEFDIKLSDMTIVSLKDFLRHVSGQLVNHKIDNKGLVSECGLNCPNEAKVISNVGVNVDKGNCIQNDDPYKQQQSVFDKISKHYNIPTVDRVPNAKVVNNNIVESKKPEPIRTKQDANEAEVVLVDDKKEKKASNNQTDRLMELAEDIRYFKDQNGDPFYFINNECKPIENIGSFLTYRLNKVYNDVAHKDVVKNVVETLKSRVMHEEDVRNFQLYNRVCKCTLGEEGKSYEVFCYDMGKGKAIEITSDSWKMRKAPSVFRYNKNLKQQVEPEPNGNPWKLFDYVHVADENKLLFLVTIISYLIPEIPHPIFHPYGPQGSGKTFLCTLVKSLIDPSSVTTFFKSNKIEDIVQQLNNNYVCMYDNFSSISNELSDLFAVACTGASFTKRKLYTDHEDVVFKLYNCVGINGINLQIRRDDLMDRTILLHLERIPDDNRLEETVMLRDFEKNKPIILGGIFDVIVKAKGIYPSVRLEKLPRMADFYKWGYAIAEALDGKGEQFIEDYNKNIEFQKEMLVEDNLLTQAIITKMESGDIWETTVKSAFEELKRIANPDKNDPTFPRDPKTLVRHLDTHKATLNDEGIYFEKGKRTSGGYPIKFYKKAKF